MIQAKIQIKNRFTNAVMFECAAPDGIESGLHLRHALEQAVIAKTNLRGADLRSADLRGADLRSADLRGAYLLGADLGSADLRGAYLRGAYLLGADLGSADLRGAYLGGADLGSADLGGANLGGADDKPLPRATPEQAIENLDRVRAVILENQERLEMSHWHGNSDWKDRTCAEEAVCGTTHCLAGWLQVCTTEPALREIDSELAGILCAPVASKMFYRGATEVLDWLEQRKYVQEAMSVAPKTLA